MLAVPQLRRNEDVLAVDTGLLDTGPDFGFVAVDSGTVDVRVPVAEGDFHGLLNFVRSGEPGAEADGWNGGAGVESEGLKELLRAC